MKGLFLYLLCFFAFAFVVEAQTSAPRALLEVREFNFDAVSPVKDYLFLKVFDNGQIEYEKDSVENNARKLVLHKYELSPVRFENLTAFLDNPEILDIADEYEPDFPIIDHTTTFDISLFRSSKTQTIKLTNYNLSNPKSKDKYPAKLAELVCRIRALRDNTGFRMLGNDCLLK